MYSYTGHVHVRRAHIAHICKSWCLQYCGAADNNSEDEGRGAVLKCLVAANQSLTTSCLSEVQRALASALMLYQPVSLWLNSAM